MSDNKPASQTTLVSIEPFTDYRALQCENYSISFTEHYTIFTQNKATLFINPEGGSVIFPEENDCELERVYFKDNQYFVSFFPNQAALIRTSTGLYMASTEDHFMGYYSFGFEDNVKNCNRSVVLLKDKDLYFVNTAGEVVKYDLEAILEDMRFKQDSWGIKTVHKRVQKFDIQAKDVVEGNTGVVYAFTAKGLVKTLDTDKSSEIKVEDSKDGERIHFTALAATKDYVCISGYLPDIQHNAIQLLKADLSEEIEGPLVTPSDCK